jgi:hypothetical protein
VSISIDALGILTNDTAPLGRLRNASRKPRSPATSALSGNSHFGRTKGEPGVASILRAATHRRWPCQCRMSRRVSRLFRFTRSTGMSSTAEEYLQAFNPQWMELASPALRARLPSILAGRVIISTRYRAAFGGATITMGNFDIPSNKRTVRLSKLTPCMRTNAFDLPRRNDSPAARTTILRAGPAAESDMGPSLPR